MSFQEYTSSTSQSIKNLTLLEKSCPEEQLREKETWNLFIRSMMIKDDQFKNHLNLARMGN
jgi:hypothetical protein